MRVYDKALLRAPIVEYLLEKRGEAISEITLVVSKFHRLLFSIVSYWSNMFECAVVVFFFCFFWGIFCRPDAG